MIEQDVHKVQESGVAQTIRDHAKELDTDLVILCAHGDGGLREKVFGSIAQQVIRQGSIPVLYLRPGGKCCSETDIIRHILLPLDGAKKHEDAIPAAVEVAGITGATIHLLTVVPTAETLPIKSALMSRVSPRTSRLALENSAQQAEAYLQHKATEISSREVQVSASVLRGDISARVNDIIAAKNIDLVVIATHGHSTLDASWEGSLTPGFLPNTPVPVLLVRGSEENS